MTGLFGGLTTRDKVLKFFAGPLRVSAQGNGDIHRRRTNVAAAERRHEAHRARGTHAVPLPGAESQSASTAHRLPRRCQFVHRPETVPPNSARAPASAPAGAQRPRVTAQLHPGNAERGAREPGKAPLRDVETERNMERTRLIASGGSEVAVRIVVRAHQLCIRPARGRRAEGLARSTTLDSSQRAGLSDKHARWRESVRSHRSRNSRHHR